jgi:effector-binding domain-containing protein
VDVTIRTVEASPTAVVAGTLDLPAFMPRLDAVYAFLRSGTDVRQTGQNVALYPRTGGMEVGVEVDRAFEPSGDVVPSQLPAGRVATATHTTGYADLHLTYEAIRSWCADNGHAITGDTWEIYGDPDERGGVAVEVVYLLS